MLRIVIFSFDRALQLDKLLRSLEKNFCFEYTIKVIYSASDDKFEQGYGILKEKYSGRKIFFEKEKTPGSIPFHLLFSLKNLYRFFKYKWLQKPKSNFRSLVENELKGDGEDFFMFLTDDSIFYREVNLDPEIFSLIKQNPKEYSYKLGLGKNILPAPDLTERKNFLSWNYYDESAKGDWAYPFSVDGVIYHRKTLSSITKRILYTNPNSFEGFVVEYVKRKKIFSLGICPKESCLIGFELNRVQTVNSNNHMNISPTMLNDYLLAGYSLEYMHDAEPSAFHAALYDVILSNEKSGEKILLLSTQNIA